jgi:hypothetical protein
MKRQALVLFGLLTLSACADTIHPVSFARADPTMLVNGRRNGICQKHEVFSGSPDAGVGNYEQAGTCSSEAAVFAQGNAMGLQDAVAVFTDKKGDQVDVPMRAPFEVPVNIFVMVPDVNSGSVPDRVGTAGSDLTSASQLYDVENQCGIKYRLIGQVHDASNVPLQNTSVLTDSCKGNVAPFKAVAAAVLGSNGASQPAVNVFYTERDQDTLGEECDDGSSAVITIGQFSRSETLAHELGHALSLCHPNDPMCFSGDLTKMPKDDLMKSPSSGATVLTAAQCFRTNVNSNSVLHGLSIRTDAARLCPDSADTLTCPVLWLHK